jgi:hypothetical protein
MEWTGSFKLAKTWKERFIRHVARTHVERINHGASPRGLGPLLAVLMASLGASARSRFLPEPDSDRVRRAEGLAAARVGEGLLVHDERSGDVHLLDPVSGWLFESTENEMVLADLLRQCPAPPETTAERLRILIERELFE